MSEHLSPVKARTAPREPIPANVPAPSIDDRLTVLADALEVALDAEATPKVKADMLAKVRDGRPNADRKGQ